MESNNAARFLLLIAFTNSQGERGGYFLGNWQKAIIDDDERQSNAILTTSTFYETAALPEVFNEMSSLAISILELNGVDPDKYKRLGEMKAKKDIMFDVSAKGILSGLGDVSEELRKLLQRMLDNNIHVRPKYNEFVAYPSWRRKIQELQTLIKRSLNVKKLPTLVELPVNNLEVQVMTKQTIKKGKEVSLILKLFGSVESE